MCASPISASDAPADPIGRLWRASRMAGPSEQLLMLAELPRASDPLQAAIIPAVARHLRARALLSLAMLDGAQAEASKGLSAWDGVAAAIGSVDPQMAVRAHAFHARLASRHLDAYRDFARRQLLELVDLDGEDVGLGVRAAYLVGQRHRPRRHERGIRFAR